MRRPLFGLLVLGVFGCGAEPRLEANLIAISSAVPRYRVELAETSASGLSSGGFMAVQFHVAYSASMVGAAVFAGGPFYCAQGSIANATNTCMSSSSGPSASTLVAATRRFADQGLIDPVENLAAQRIFLFGGASDSTVNPAVMDALAEYYRALAPQGSVTFERRRPGTAHTMPTENYGGTCSRTSSPYLGRCGYDGAGRALDEIYGPLSPKAIGALDGTWLEIPQRDFTDNPRSHSLAETAYAYVPRSCAEGELCRIHVAFHGCLQDSASVGDAFYAHAGYNEWADTNRVIVLYPQTIRTSGSNPNACWDWWGYDSADYATQRGPQLAMVKAIVDHLGGSVSESPDAGMADVGASTPDAGAPALDAGAPLADAGSGDPTPIGGCVRASNSAHVAAGRANAELGIAYAVGSGQALGLVGPWIFTALRRVGRDDYVVGFCY